MEEVVTNVDENLEVDTQGGSTDNTNEKETIASADTKELLGDDTTNKANDGEEKVEPKDSTKADATKGDEKLIRENTDENKDERLTELEKREKELSQKEKDFAKKELEVKLNEFFKSEGMGENITKSFMELDIDGDKALDLAKELSEGFKKALEEKLSEKMQGSSPNSSSGNVGKNDKSSADIFARALRG